MELGTRALSKNEIEVECGQYTALRVMVYCNIEVQPLACLHNTVVPWPLQSDWLTSTAVLFRLCLMTLTSVSGTSRQKPPLGGILSTIVC